MKANNVDYVLQDGKIVSVTIDGKPVKAGFMRGLRKAQETPYWERIDTPVIATNPFSGVRVELNDFEATIYNFCIRWSRRAYNGLETNAPLQTFDDMKYFLLELNSNAYYSLLD